MSFVFATCRAGSEPSLKADVARWHEGRLTPAFMRPQLITWKVRGQPPDSGFVLDSPFARVSGLSLGLCASAAELIDKLRATGALPLPACLPARDTGGRRAAGDMAAHRRAAGAIISALTDAGFQLRPRRPSRTATSCWTSCSMTRTTRRSSPGCTATTTARTGSPAACRASPCPRMRLRVPG
ncbi:MAG: hypothetical protein HS117_12535 [Verrucomicrobiaceae bacterium]|nr:hypothetical protein [Verrucomicrobiaceae bacterium]